MFLYSMALVLAFIALGVQTVQAQPEDQQAEKKGALKGDRDGQGMMGGG